MIPARLGSTRFPGKVLADLAGRPVVWHVHERLAAAELVDAVLVATDSDEVAAAVRGFGGEAVLVSTPCSTGSDRVAEAVREREAHAVVNLQADQPLIEPSDIDRAIEVLRADRSLDMTTLAFRSDDPAAHADPHVVKVVTDHSGRALYFSRAAIPSSPEAGAGRGWYLHHVGLYCFRREALMRFAALERSPLELRESLEQLRALENSMAIGVVTASTETWSIDRPGDLTKVERRLAEG
ncbi:MAG: 3-deoxy-manno-octulosonate cytidylyltransferase [Candidatus Eisenbacteria bacterium]|nr:3-deoxy-manno-octulosonate cytidylyltransferase [Candidatus Eisenbacteria bacterium]